MGLELFRVKKGFSINGEIEQLYGSADPSSGGGVAAPTGSVYFRTNGELWHKVDSDDTDWNKLLDSSGASVEDSYQNDFMGKSLGENLPQYTEENHIDDDDSLNTAVDRLDMYIGENPTPETRTNNPVTLSGDVNENIEALDKAIGDDADLTTTNYVTLNSTIMAKIAALDAALKSKNPYKISANNQDCAPAVSVDSMAKTSVMSVLWKVTVRETSTPTNMYSCMINCVQDETNFDYDEFGTLVLGNAISGLTIAPTIDGSNNLVLQIGADNNIDYRVERISQ